MRRSQRYVTFINVCTIAASCFFLGTFLSKPASLIVGSVVLLLGTCVGIFAMGVASEEKRREKRTA